MRYCTHILLLSLLFFSCSEEDVIENSGNRNVEILLAVDRFTGNATTGTGTTDPGTDEEREIRNLYLFLFSNEEVNAYYIENNAFSGGVWTDGKITLDLTQQEAGNRSVYLVANCESVKTQLESTAINSPEDLKRVVSTLSQPWSPQLTTPVLMVGTKVHDFTSNYQLNKIALERAVAKLKLNITPSNNQQSATGEYKYRFVNFSANTNLLKDETRTGSLHNSAWFTGTAQNGTFAIETYLNEHTATDDKRKTGIEISIPDKQGGALPPPEFGEEVYRLSLPQVVERNTSYQYTISFDDDLRKK